MPVGPKIKTLMGNLGSKGSKNTVQNIDLLPLAESTEEKLDVLVRASHALGIEDVSFTR